MIAHDKYDKDILKALQKIGGNLDKINQNLAAKPAKNESIKPVYLVYGDTYFDEYGSLINCFGIFDTKEEALYTKKEKEDEYYQKDLDNEYSDTHISRKAVNFNILELKPGNIVDVYLGGHTE